MFARLPIPVVLVGETGTGKELVAEALHEGSAAKGALVAVNCANLHEGLAESLLFGHEAGAFTDARRPHVGFLASANGGTLFLDEIAELPPHVQSKLLRALENGEYRPLGSNRTQRSVFRIIAATSRDMPALVQSGEFRRDLFYRLGAIQIEIPALRFRVDDIPALSRYFLEEFAGKVDIPIPGLPTGSLALLQAQRWPGNLRQLRAVLEASFAFVEDGKIRESDLKELIANLSLGPQTSTDFAVPLPLSLDEIGANAERRAIVERLALTGTVENAARSLKVSKQTLYRRMHDLGIDLSPGSRGKQAEG
jgi:DNA-binding NtrC family response regulator